MKVLKYSLPFLLLLNCLKGQAQWKNTTLGYSYPDTLSKTVKPNSFINYCLIKSSANVTTTTTDFLKGYKQCKSCEYKYYQGKYMERLYTIQLNHSYNAIDLGKNKYVISSYATYYNNLYGTFGSSPWIKLPKIKALHRNVHINRRGALLLSN